MTTTDARLKIANIVRELGAALHALDQIDECADNPAEVAEQCATISSAFTQVHLDCDALSIASDQELIEATPTEEEA